MPELQLNLENIHLTNLQPGRANIMVSNTAIVKSLSMRINVTGKTLMTHNASLGSFMLSTRTRI